MDESRIADPSSALRRSDRSLPTRLSRAVSVVLHPLVMPLYVILLLVAGPTQLSYFPASVKFYLLWVTVLYTAVIPLLSVGLLRSVGRISSLAIDDRRERILPLAIGIVCYLLVAITAVLCSFDAVSGSLLFFGHSVDFKDFCWLLFGISTCTYHALRSYHLHKKLDLIGAAFWFVILVLYFIKIL